MGWEAFTTVIISALATTVAGLASILYKNALKIIKDQRREIRYLTTIIVNQGAKKDEMMAEYKRFLDAKDLGGE